MSYGIVSYAQNFEDVLLWRALGHVAEGRYVDIGAQSATEDSVSMAFHQKGWRGLHVEPVPMYAQQLRDGRPGDTVIQAMVASQEGVQKFYAMPDTGLSTSREDLADGYREGGFAVNVEVVPVVTLDQVLEVAGGEVHWLKIDVEGAELEVLRGWRGPVRPWVLVIESTRPTSQEQEFAAWEPLVTQKGYEFAYFDGLNRFYISAEHPELASKFSVGPNVFDRFELSGSATSTFAAQLNATISGLRGEVAAVVHDLNSLESQRINERREFDEALLRQRLEGAEREKATLAEGARAFALATRLQDELEQLRVDALAMVDEATRETLAERDAAKIRADQLQADLLIIHRSTSWTVTAPLRGAARLARASVVFPVLLARRARAWFKRGFMGLVFATLRVGSRSRIFRAIGRRVVHVLPVGQARLRAWNDFALDRGEVKNFSSVPVASSLDSSLPEGISAHASQGVKRLRSSIRAKRY